jgi:hypothetical protein
MKEFDKIEHKVYINKPLFLSGAMRAKSLINTFLKLL